MRSAGNVKILPILSIALLLMLFCGCTAVPVDLTEWENSDAVTVSKLEQHYAGNDPCEGFNRSMFAVTDFTMTWIADPIGRVYCTIIPRPVIECIDNFCRNLEFPGKLFGCLLQGQWRGAGDETVRFLTNTTLGLAGFFDPAKHWFGFYPTGVNFGQTFAAWGIPSGCTFMLPFSSALNIRDTAGLLFDAAFDGKTYIPYCGTATFLNRMTMAEASFRQATDGASDTYKAFRSKGQLMRELQQELWSYHYSNRAYADYQKRCAEQNTSTPQPPPLPEELPHTLPDTLAGKKVFLTGYHPVDPYQDSLRSILPQPEQEKSFWYTDRSFFNRDFPNLAENGRWKADPALPGLRYSYWEKIGKPDTSDCTEPVDLAVILPGIGGVRNGNLVLTLAELCRQEGLAVISLDSTFNWNSYVSRTDGKHPGLPENDAAFLRSAVAGIIKHLEEKHGINFRHRVLMGYSFGAVHTLKMAEQYHRCDPENQFDRYIAINPPVSLDYAMRQTELLAQSGSSWSIEERHRKLMDTAGYLLARAGQHYPVFDPRSPREPINSYIVAPGREASQLLVSLSFGMPLRELLYTMHRKEDLDFFQTPHDQFRRDLLYREIDMINFRQYAQKVILKDHPGMTIEELYRQSDLRSDAEFYRSSERISVLHSWDDFLINADDKAFLDRTFGSRMIWFSCGSHLGNLYDQRVRQEIIALLQR